MKKITLFLAALAVAGSSFAYDGKCCKGKKEACSKEKKEACAKGKGCCKKGAESKTTSTTTTTSTATPKAATK
ncbi:MAG TPA: hypothetical protein VL092_09015 [Chitinophagaceae bacterium]|nr:hypothetical protein [Chitinophagaceae bacterium]